ncbi:MAG: hypothetical protein MN733_26325, partial [Nitrososphaera sp.]|nr:hypothetical protein [Nitrososphaera sp.]
YLSLSKGEARALFLPELYEARYEARPGNHGFISDELAVRVLRHIALTGVIDWTLTAETNAPMGDEETRHEAS